VASRREPAPAGDAERRHDQQERPPPVCGARGRERIEVPQFANRHAEQADERPAHDPRVRVGHAMLSFGAAEEGAG
jgi:hypothetical protein